MLGWTLYPMERKAERKTKRRPLCGNGQESRQAVESWKGFERLERHLSEARPSTTDTKAGEPTLTPLPPAQVSLVLERRRPGQVRDHCHTRRSGPLRPSDF